MPLFLKVLSMVGMVAMLWVGGGILIHGLHHLGLHGPEEAVHHAAEAVARLLPSVGDFLSWLTSAALAAALGVIVGALVNPLVEHLILPTWKRLKPSGRS
jgi:predicted DNA repair protein MutK